MADLQDDAGLEFPQEAGPPRNDIYTFLLVVAFVMVLVAIFLTCSELREFYDVKFGVLS